MVRQAAPPDVPAAAFSPIAARPWREARPPRRILAIRLQALGDVVITLPYLAALRRALPTTPLDLLTREEDRDLPAALTLFDDVHALGGGRTERRQLVHAAGLAVSLRSRGHDVVLDLQNSRVSGAIRRLIRPQAWSAFDRFSPVSAGERTRRTIEAAGFPLPLVTPGLTLKDDSSAVALLRAAGWRPDRELVVLSPAGDIATRNWPLPSYVEFAASWARRRAAQFVVLGLPPLAPKAAFLRERIGASLLDLVGRTSPSEALAVVQKASLAVAEDGGLMHMAWTSGVPTLALFGSSPHVWSAPLGNHSRCLHSGDLPCGACLSATCRYGDVRCLTRYTAERVVEEAERLLRDVAGTEKIVARL